MKDDELLAQRKADLAKDLMECEGILEVDYEPHLASFQNLQPDMIVVSVKAWSKKHNQSLWVETVFHVELFLDRAVCLPDLVLSQIEMVIEAGPPS